MKNSKKNTTVTAWHGIHKGIAGYWIIVDNEKFGPFTTKAEVEKEIKLFEDVIKENPKLINKKNNPKRKKDPIVKEFTTDVKNKWKSLSYGSRFKWLVFTGFNEEKANTFAGLDWHVIPINVQYALIDSYMSYWKKYKKNPSTSVNPTSKKVIVLKNSSTGEYRVPGPANTEAQAYYTDDRNDAIGTAKLMWKGIDIVFTFRTIPDFDKFLKNSGIKWHEGQAIIAVKKHNKAESQREKDFWQGILQAHRTSISADKFGANPGAKWRREQASDAFNREAGAPTQQVKKYYEGTKDAHRKSVIKSEQLGINPPIKAKEVKEAINKKIRVLIEEGYPQKQAIAIAIDMAHKAGFKIPKR